MGEHLELENADKEFGFAVLVRGEIKDEPFWAYLAVFPSKYEDFIQVQKEDKPYKLTDYGELIEYKIGETDPPAEVARRIEEEHGVDHDFQSKLEEVVERATAYFSGMKPK